MSGVNKIEYISKKDEQDIIISSKLERHQVLTAINNIFPDIKEHIFINKFEELLNSSKQFEYIENFNSEKYSGAKLLKSLVLNCSQQFCFWLIQLNLFNHHQTILTRQLRQNTLQRRTIHFAVQFLTVILWSRSESHTTCAPNWTASATSTRTTRTLLFPRFFSAATHF